jgi:hypothetical protein
MSLVMLIDSSVFVRSVVFHPPHITRLPLLCPLSLSRAAVPSRLEGTARQVFSRVPPSRRPPPTDPVQVVDRVCLSASMWRSVDAMLCRSYSASDTNTSHCYQSRTTPYHTLYSRFRLFGSRLQSSASFWLRPHAHPLLFSPAGTQCRGEHGMASLAGPASCCAVCLLADIWQVMP